MAIDQEAAAEPALGIRHQPAQCPVIGMVKAVDPAPGVGKVQLFRIDFFTAGDDPGDRAEPHPDPRRCGIDEAGQRIAEHPRVELVSLAIDIDIGSGKSRRQKRDAEAGGGGEQLVDKAVFRAPQG